jgi:hypothetical protein
VRAAETVDRTSRGYDAGKNVNGRRRHIVVDTTGLLLVVLVTGASRQDRDAARLLLWTVRVRFPSIRRLWCDGGYSGHLVDWAKTTLAWPSTSSANSPGKSASRSCQTLGGRTDVRVDQPLSAQGPRPREAARSPRPRWSNGPWSSS